MSLHVTAVVTCHDYERFLPEALRSVLEQDDPAELLDVVVVDDGSTDGSLAIARAAADAHPGRVTVLSGPNEGYVAASARGYAVLSRRPDLREGFGLPAWGAESVLRGCDQGAARGASLMRGARGESTLVA